MRMIKRLSVALPAVLAVALTGTADEAVGSGLLRDEVERIERAFASTMADRDFDAFRSFLSEEAVFFAGEEPLEGKEAVASAWAAYFEGEQAPFSWEPDSVVVLESGTLALSSGPVFDAAGNRVATFQSVWRREVGGSWRIVFDKGHRYCPPRERSSG